MSKLLRITIGDEPTIELPLYPTSVVNISKVRCTIEDVSTDISVAMMNTEVLVEGLLEFEIRHVPQLTSITITEDAIFEETEV